MPTLSSFTCCAHLCMGHPSANQLLCDFLLLLAFFSGFLALCCTTAHFHILNSVLQTLVRMPSYHGSLSDTSWPACCDSLEERSVPSLVPRTTEQLANFRCVFVDELRMAYRKDLGTLNSIVGSDLGKSPSAPTSVFLYWVIFYSSWHLRPQLANLVPWHSLILGAWRSVCSK